MGASEGDVVAHSELAVQATVVARSAQTNHQYTITLTSVLRGS